MLYAFPDIAIIGNGFSVSSRVAAEALTIPPNIQFLITGGFYASGDGGGASYKRVGSIPAVGSYFQSDDGALWALEPDEAGYNVLAYGAKDNDLYDNADIFDPTNIRGAVYTSTWFGIPLVIPFQSNGVYCSSETFKFNASNFTLVGQGMPVLKYTGSISPAFQTRAATSYIVGLNISNIVIEGNPDFSSLDGWDMYNVVRSTFSNIRAREITGTAFPFKGLVNNTFINLECSGNTDVFTVNPVAGLDLDGTPEVTASTANTFINAKLEHIGGDGIIHRKSDNNTFLGGATESNTGYGIIHTADSNGNTHRDMAMEINTLGDVVLDGSLNKVIDGYCHSRGVDPTPYSIAAVTILATAVMCGVVGASVFYGIINNGAKGCFFRDVKGQRLSNLSATSILDNRRSLFDSVEYFTGRSFGNYTDPDNSVLDYYQRDITVEGVMIVGSTNAGTMTLNVNVNNATRIGDITITNVSLKINTITDQPLGDVLITGIHPFTADNLPMPAIIGDYWLTYPPGGPFTGVVVQKKAATQSLSVLAVGNNVNSVPLRGADLVINQKIDFTYIHFNTH